MRHHEITLQPHKHRFQGAKPCLTAQVAGTPRRLQIDMEQATRLVKKLDEIKGITANVLLGILPLDPSPEVLGVLEKLQNTNTKYVTFLIGINPFRQRLDLLIEYLNRVHWHCYYLVQVFPSHHHRLYEGLLVLRPSETFKSEHEING
jgi:hypothetical protein